MAIKDELLIGRLSKSDLPAFQQLIQLFGVVFEMEEIKNAPEHYLASLLANDAFVVYVAIHNGEVVGGATGYIMPMYYAVAKELYIYDMAVATNLQGMGVGKKLIAGLKGYCAQNAVSCMFVEAQEEDNGAIEFYRATSGAGERVVHFNYDMPR